MTNPPGVGVVMTAYNSQAFIEAALRSLIEQSFTDWYCVVVDDGSTDETVRLVRRLAGEDGRIELVTAAHGGVSRARNLGLGRLPARPPFVAFLDSDDCYLPEALRLLTRALADRPDAIGVYGVAEFIDADGRPYAPGAHSGGQRRRRAVRGQSVLDLHPGEDSTFADLCVVSAIWPSAVSLHRRSAIEAAGRFDESFTRQGDWDLYVRLSRLGPYAVLAEQVAWYRRHAANLTGSVLQSCYQQDRVRCKAYHHAGNTPQQRATVGRAAWRLRLAELRRTVRRLRQDFGDRRPAAVAAGLRSTLILGASLCRLAPPRPSMWRVRWTQMGQDDPRRDGLSR